MIVVADTSPVNYLVLIQEIDVLPKIYGRVVIPQTCSRFGATDGSILDGPLAVLARSSEPFYCARFIFGKA